MANACARRHDAKPTERLLSPFQEHITFVVALHFRAYVFFKCLIITKTIDGHRVVNDQSTGESGLTFAVSPPRRLTASRIAARSTTAGTPVKSCISTLAGR